VRALKDAYKGFLFDSRQPVAFLALAMDPARVDVNVHPAKSDVRFREERRLFGFLVNAIREAVRTCDMATPGAALVERAIVREERALPFTGAHAATAPLRSPNVHEPLRVYDLPPRAAPAPSAPVRDDGDAVHGPFLQIAATYIVRPVGDGFEIVDQHALHERIQFESLVAEMRRGQVETQRLLVPELVELSRAEVAALAEHVETLARIGIDLQAFGATTIAVQGLPARLARPRPEAIVREVLAAIEAARALEPERLLEDVLHRAACRSSVMAGDVLSGEEMRALLERGRHLLSDQTCVHGRPTRVRFVGADLERAFERR
jgi:DNA mismatch repair protein MutL